MVGPGPLLPGCRPAALVPILGRSPLQRHVAHLAAAEVERCVVALEDGPEAEKIAAAFRRQLASAPTGAMSVEVQHAANGGRMTIAGGETELVVWLRAEGVYDARLYRRIVRAGAPTWIADSAAPGAAEAGGRAVAIGMSALVAASRGIPGPDGRRLSVDDMPPYMPSLRRHLRPYWVLVCRDADRDRARAMILDAAQKGVLDFPARYLHPPAENFLAALLSSTRVTPNHVSIATGLVGFAATGLFAAGAFAWGLVLALVTNVLDGVDGKLARITLRTSRFGDRLDHILDVAFEFSWYLALGWGLSGGDAGGAPLRLAAGLIVVMVGTRAVSGIYKQLSGRQIHDHRAFDRAFRLVAARRNIYVMVLVVGLLAGHLATAFLLCFAWGLSTLLVYGVRTALERRLAR